MPFLTHRATPGDRPDLERGLVGLATEGRWVRPGGERPAEAAMGRPFAIQLEYCVGELAHVTRALANRGVDIEHVVGTSAGDRMCARITTDDDELARGSSAAYASNVNQAGSVWTFKSGAAKTSPTSPSPGDHSRPAWRGARWVDALNRNPARVTPRAQRRPGAAPGQRRSRGTFGWRGR